MSNIIHFKVSRLKAFRSNLFSPIPGTFDLQSPSKDTPANCWVIPDGTPIPYPSDVKKVLAALKEQRKLQARKHTNLEWDIAVLELEKCLNLHERAEKRRNKVT
jgi:hypothetical protein